MKTIRHGSLRAFLGLTLAASAAPALALPVRVTTPIGGGALEPGFTSHAEFAGSGEWVIYQNTSDQLTVPSDGNSDMDVFAYSRTSGTTTRLSLAPNSATPSAQGCDLLSVSADGRFVLMSCIRSGWFEPYTDPALDTATALEEFVLLDRDTDADGVFDEPGATQIKLVTELDGGVRAPQFFKHSVAMSPNGRYIAFSGFFVGSPCTSQFWVRDRDTDADGIFDEPGANALTCVPGAYSANVQYSLRATDAGEAIFVGSVTGHPAYPNYAPLVPWVVQLNTGTITRLSPNGSDSQSFYLRDVSDDGRRVLLDIGSVFAGAPLPIGSHLLDRDTGIWTRPFDHDARFAGLSASAAAMDRAGTEILSYGPAFAEAGAPGQIYSWRVGDPYMRRIAGYADGRVLRGSISGVDVAAGRYLVLGKDDAFAPNTFTSGPDAFIFDGTFDVRPSVATSFYHSGDTGPVVDHQFSLLVRPTLVGEEEAGPVDIRIGPLDAYRFTVVFGTCTYDGTTLTCSQVHAAAAGFEPLIRIDLTPTRGGSRPITVTAVQALADSNPANDTVTLPLTVSGGSGGGGGGSTDPLLWVLALAAAEWRRRMSTAAR